MKLNANIATIAYVIASMGLIVTLVVLLVKCKNKSDFCICQGMHLQGHTGDYVPAQFCPDPNNLKKLYAEGKLTEYTIGN